MKYKMFLLAVALVVASSAVQAGLITCWYNERGEFTGADTAESGTKAGGPVRKSESGDYTWAWTHEAQDGTTCPRKMPVPRSDKADSGAE